MIMAYEQFFLEELLNFNSYGLALAGVYVVLILAIAVVKGFALFKAARLHEKVWFWVLFFVNTFAVLDVYYLYSRRRR